MAKWGEGDPRWIVEERPDATNVNNWHWVEKNATGWSQDKLKELLVGLIIEDANGTCKIKELTKVEGEASANNRKAKLIFFYEWDIDGEWSGELKDGKKSYKGKFDIPNLSEENDPEDIDVNVTCDNTSEEAFRVKEIMRNKGTEIIRQQLSKYIRGLREEYGQGIILPTKGDAPVNSNKSVEQFSIFQNKAKEEISKFVTNCSEQMQDMNVRICTKKLVTKEEFKCRASDLYRALTDKQMVEAFTGGSVILEAAKGKPFSLMGGNIVGEFVELIPDKKIVQRWRIKSWPETHYSDVTIELVEKEDKTVLHLTQLGVPESEYDRTIEGWKTNYWQRMKHIFGFSSQLF